MHLLAELGLTTLYHSPVDVHLIILSRFVRFFAFGGSTIVLVLYLHALSIPDSRIGLFLSLALLGDVFSFVLTLFADTLGRRRVLALGAAMMIASGLVFACAGNWWVLLSAGALGVISPNGREIGPFSAIEESSLAHLTVPEKRSDIFAWYTLIGSGGSAAGKLTVGWAVQWLVQTEGWSHLQAYQAVFFGYAMLGGLHFGLACTLSKRIELDRCQGKANVEGSAEEPLLLPEDCADGVETKEMNGWMPSVSSLSYESRSIVMKLCVLFAVDSLASGLVPASWVTYFFHVKFNLPEGSLGTLFFITGLLSAASSLVAVSLSRRIGLIRTMVFTHLPSAIALALIPLPSTLSSSIFFLILRSSLASMDIAPKAAFLSMVVLPEERTAVMGFISVVRTFSQSCGPVVTGVLAQAGTFWVTFVVAGSLKAAYDFGLLAGFRSYVITQDRRDERSSTENVAIER